LADEWPANVWVGASIESQEWVRPRGRKLLKIEKAPVRFISAEPLVGRLDMASLLTGTNHVEWVITGGESGHRAVPTHPMWFRDLRDQCLAADVPFFLKQNGEWSTHPGRDWLADDATTHPRRHRWVDETGTMTGACGNVLPCLTSDRLDRPLTRPLPVPAGELVHMHKVGKRNAGRALDGREWSDVPPMPVPVAA